MSTRIGLVQTRGIGDIIIALPIADYFIRQGMEVVWPIDERFLPAFRAANPRVNFVGLAPEPGMMYDTPMRLLQEHGCERAFCLYSYLSIKKVYDERLAWSLKFDEYKYAITGVPFAEKWNLNIVRDRQREQALYDRLNISRPYICLHDTGWDRKVDIPLPPEWIGDRQLVGIESLTDNPFDWLLTLERADRLVLLDSCFSNLVEQLNLPNEKYLVLRSPVPTTPVMKNGWRFIKLMPSATTAAM
jgi:hypothetical protein